MLQNVFLLGYSVLLWIVTAPRRFFEIDDVPAVRPVLGQVDTLRAELTAYLESTLPAAIQELDKDERMLGTDTNWRGVPLRFWGNDIELTRSLLPRTAAILDDVPGLVTAWFSVLGPGKEIGLHPGVFKGILRVHVPIVIPDGDAAIRVLGKTRRWKDHDVLVFDDAFLHSAWNRTDAPRTVLIMDLERPFRWFWLERLNEKVLGRIHKSARVQRAVENAEEYLPEQHPAIPVSEW